jgi:hypothetical protein
LWGSIRAGKTCDERRRLPNQETPRHRGDKTQETITTTYSDSFNRTNTQTDVKENLGNTSLTVGGGAGDSLPLLIGGGLIVAAFLALR